MGKLFGTDGIRGVVGENLTADLAFRTGKAIAAVLKEEKGRKPVITIGKDTRISSDMLESALIAGICSVGGDVMPFGVLPTPAVAYLTVLKGADAGIVISASHNPYEHNGIKVFNEKGYKLPDAIEEQVEEKILTDIYPAATHGEIGVLRHGLRQSREAYIDHLAGSIESDLSGLRVLVDCSNGASSATAPELFGRFRCFCDFIHREPDGVNINERCGSTHLDDLAAKVVAGGYDIGVAFDGDADRCLLVDEKGGVIDGDKVLAVCGSDMKRRGKLSGGTIVATGTPEEIAACIRRELLRADLVITTGGASVGDYDYAETVFLKMGARQLFRRLSFKPGGTMLAGVKDSKVILGLSGNPGAAAVGLLRVAAPYIRKLCGRSDWLWEEMNLRLKVPFQKPSPDMRLIQGQLSVENGCAYFVESPRQANGTVSSLVQCSLLAEIPAGSPPLAAGTMVKAYRIE